MSDRKQSRTREPHQSKRPPRKLLIGALLGAIVVVGGGCGASTTPGAKSTALEALPNPPGVSHIHGLGVNPANGDVYAATHGGLFNIAQDGKATHIANRYQDTMGFTIVGSDHFLASGHPDLREDLPPLLGLLESTDGAKTWTKKSLLGKADFHTLRYAHDTVYGFNATDAAFMVSKDKRTWETRSKTTLRDFVVSPTDPDVIIATTPNGLEQSSDGGRNWTKIQSPPQPVLLDWEKADRLWLIDFDGQLHVSTDGAQIWEARGKATERPDAFDAAGNAMYVGAGGVISVSKDEGRTWQVFYREVGTQANHS